MSISTVIYPVADLAAAKAQYAVLAGEPVMDSPHYVGYQLGPIQVGLAPRHSADEGPLAYWDVPDIHAAIAALTAAGASAVLPVTDVGEGKLVAVVVDRDGNRIGLTQPAD